MLSTLRLLIWLIGFREVKYPTDKDFDNALKKARKKPRVHYLDNKKEQSYEVKGIEKHG